jgi:hypothetical protein
LKNRIGRSSVHSVVDVTIRFLADRLARFAATDVLGDVVPENVHWIIEENPSATIRLIRGFPRRATAN